MADLLLEVVLVDLGRRGKAGHIASDRQLLLARKLGRIAAQAGGKRSLLDETRDLLIVELVRSGVLALAGDATEEAPFGKLGELGPGFDGGDGVCGVSGAAAGHSPNARFVVTMIEVRS